MSWHFSRALVAEFSGGSSSGGGRCVRSNSMPLPVKNSWPDKTTVASVRSRSGRTFAASPHEITLCGPSSARFAACAIASSSREDFPARVSASPAKALASMIRAAGFGVNNAVSLARFDPVTCGLKTHQRSLLEEGFESLLTLPPWGMIVAGELFQLPTPSGLVAHRASITSVSGFGLPERVPTPCATEVEKDLGNYLQKRALPCSQKGGSHGPNLATYIKLPQRIPTPRKIDGRSATENTSDGCLTRRLEKEGGTNLPEFVQMSNRGLLPVTRVPTPVASDANSPGQSGTREVGQCLSVVVRRVPTPTTQDASNNGAVSQMERNTKPLNAEVGGPLNPEWVEWLMGWPVGWTDSHAPVTDRFRQWLSSHGRF